MSGCHLNPAVTLCLAIVNKIPKVDVPGYIIAQCVGAAIGGYVLYMIAAGAPEFALTKGFALNGFGEHSPGKYSMIACFVTEVVMTAVLLYVILASTKSYYAKGFAGLSIGLTLVAIHLVSIPVTNTSVKFARSFGVAIVHGGWATQQLWLFAAAHILAIVVALIVYAATHPKD